jgi:3-hydroxybutyryl-CoA dehydrogenase
VKGEEEMMQEKTIGVVGAGQMGSGIAQVAARSGFSVIMSDLNEELVQRGLKNIVKILTKNVEKGKISPEEKELVLGRIRTTINLREMAAAEVVIEAATENEALKFQIFRELDAICRPTAILASNTSSIPIGRIAAQTKRPGQVIGLHFMNPAPVMKCRPMT